jgi:hypothetical protein
VCCQRRFHLTNLHACHSGTVNDRNNNFKNHQYGKGFKAWDEYQIEKLINHYLLNWVICQSWLLGYGNSLHLTSQARRAFPCSFCSRRAVWHQCKWDCGRHMVNFQWLCTGAHVNYLILDMVISPVLLVPSPREYGKQFSFILLQLYPLCWFVSSDLLVWRVCCCVSWGGHEVWERDEFLECKGLQFISLYVFFLFGK